MPAMRPTDDTDTRQILLQAAFDEIHRKGYQSASLSDILRDTGLTKGALYHHFPNKHALGLAVVREVIHGRLDHILFAPLRDAEQPVDRLIHIIERHADTIDNDWVQLGCPLNNLNQEMSPLDAEFKTAVHHTLGTWRSTVQQALERDRKQGVVRADVDCKSAALFIVASWEGCIGMAKNDQSLKTLRPCLKQLAAYVKGLRVNG